MKHLHFLAGILLAILLTGCAPASTSDQAGAAPDSSAPSGTGIPYALDIPRCKLRWTASDPVASHQGIVPVSSGQFFMANGMITGGSIELNMAGLEVQDLAGEDRQQLEAHLRGTLPGREDDFFNTVQFPTATFILRQCSALADDPAGTHLISGDLRIKDITKPVTFKARVDASAGAAVKITTEPFVIDRAEWEIKYKSRKFFDNLKEDFIRDEVTLQLEIGAIRQS